MRRFRICMLLWSTASLLAACGNGENDAAAKAKKTMNGISEVVSVVKQAGKSQSRIEESMERMEELKLVAPATKEELKRWLPEDITGFKRTGFSVGNQAMADISSITGSFLNEDENKSFEVNVIDGAGEAGGVFTMVYIGQFNRDFEKVSADGFSKSMTRGNRKAIVSQNTISNIAELEYLEGDRYYVKIRGNNMDVEELWTVSDGLKTSALPGLK